VQVQPVDRLNETGLAASPHAMIIDHGHNGLWLREDGAATPAGSNLG
jgi:hypothetical protein